MTIRKFMAFGALTALVSGCATHDKPEVISPIDRAAICWHMREFYPTPMTIVTRVDSRPVVECRSPDEATYGVWYHDYKTLADVTWWATNAPERVILPDPGNGEY